MDDFENVFACVRAKERVYVWCLFVCYERIKYEEMLCAPILMYTVQAYAGSEHHRANLCNLIIIERNFISI